jgi:hypothetical protein
MVPVDSLMMTGIKKRPSFKRCGAIGRRIIAFWVFAGFAWLPQHLFAQMNTPLAGIAGAGTNSFSHKIQVSDPALARQIEAQGARLIGDYGGYRLYETAQIPAAVAGAPGVEVRDDYNVIQLHSGALDTRRAEVRSLRQARGSFTGKRLHLLQFAGPVQPQWREELLAAGAQIVCYVPGNTYLIYGDAVCLAQIQALAANAPHIQWDGAFDDGYKIHPLARTEDARGNARSIGTDVFDIQLVADTAANAGTLALLDQLKLEPFKRQMRVLHFLNVVARLNPASLAQIAARPDVVSILPYFTRQKFDERQDEIVTGNLSGNVPNGPGYLAWLAGVGFTQAQFTNFVVDLSDSGIDDGTTTPNHFGLYAGGNTTNASRVVYNILQGTPNSGSTLQGCDGHGTLNSHIISGYDDFADFPFSDSSGFHYGLGVCPFVSVGSSVIFDPSTFTSPNPNDLQSVAYQNGARISNNSWGGVKSFGVYDSEAQAYDALVRDAQPANSAVPMPGNQGMVIVFAAGNDGPNGGTVDSPGTGKNVISVGAADNVQPFGGSDGSVVSDAEASSANEIASFSSRGPCADGRAKPDLVAPATHVSGGVFQAVADLVDYPDGIAGSCYNGSGVSGGVNSIFWPANQQFYTASSGTSHSTPCVTGGCALVLQYFLNQFSTNLPSPAMTKAYLINSARYLTGATANDTLPSPAQGMGELNLGMAFDGEPRILRDQLPGDLFTASGQTLTFTGVINDTNHPFRVTVAWTDAPGSIVGKAYDNDLDLTVTIGGNTYKGNVFSGAYSTTGGAADAKNNVENVFLPAGVSGEFIINVTAANINAIGVPNSGNALCQDFALVAYNAAQVTEPFLTGAGATLTAESCLPTNGVIDPGETVTMNFALQNIGTVATSNLAATLLATNGILSPGAPQNYGALAVGGAPVSQAFTFTAGGTCGGTVTATLQLQDGATVLGSVNFPLRLGQPVPATTFTEIFDEVSAPALPNGWTVASLSGAPAWTTVTNEADTAPNAAFVPDVATGGVSELISPPIAITSTNAQLTFRNYYNLNAPSNPNGSGYDGGVLEIQIGSGPFTDIRTAGGTFVAGGYSRLISSTGDNPLAGRPAWSGNSDGFITSIIRLPAAAAGQTIQLKWRCGTDTTSGGAGWYVDTISLMDVIYVCCTETGPPVITSAPAGQIAALGTNVAFAVAAAGTAPLSYQWFFNSTNLPGETNATLNLSDVQTNQDGDYSVLVTNALGVTNADATLTVVTPPMLTSAPSNEMVLVGANAAFQANATGSLLSFQWQFNGTNLPGATTSTLMLTNVQPAEAGNYTVLITNVAGLAASAAQLIPVLPPVGLSVSGTSVAVSLQSETGLNYTLQYKDALADPAWIPVLPSVAGTGGTIILTDPAPSPSGRLYRVSCD